MALDETCFHPAKRFRQAAPPAGCAMAQGLEVIGGLSLPDVSYREESH